MYLSVAVADTQDELCCPGRATVLAIGLGRSYGTGVALRADDLDMDMDEEVEEDGGRFFTVRIDVQQRGITLEDPVTLVPAADI